MSDWESYVTQCLAWAWREPNGERRETFLAMARLWQELGHAYELKEKRKLQEKKPA